jgi:transcriptional regulator of arginine metabolism
MVATTTSSAEAGRSERQNVIRRLLVRERIASQEELRAQLARQGHRITQSSLSRDLRELGAGKIDGRYLLPEKLSGAEIGVAGWSRLAPLVRGIHPAGPHLLVVRTAPGAASAVGLAVDRSRWPEVIGTVAGDDTLFIALAGRRTQMAIETRMTELLGKKGIWR